MRKIKKFFIVSFIFIIIIQIVNTSYGATAVTKEGLERGLKSLQSTFSGEDISMQYNINEDSIAISADGETYSTKYDLTDGLKPIFTTEIPISSYTDESELSEQMGGVFSMQVIAYSLVANIQGVSPIDALEYCMTAMLKDSSSFILDDTDGLYDSKRTMTDSEGLNSYISTIEVQNLEGASPTIVTTFQVDATADFSRLKGYSNNPDESLYGYSLQDYNSSNNDDTYNYSNEPATSRSSTTSRDSTISTTELPKTGINIILLVTVLISCIIALVYAINIKRYKDVK